MLFRSRITWRAVQIAGLGNEAAFIAGDLKAGDRVVALGAHLLHEGEQVRVAEDRTARGAAVDADQQR